MGCGIRQSAGQAIEPELNRDQTLHHDSSTNGLIDFYRACQQR